MDEEILRKYLEGHKCDCCGHWSYYTELINDKWMCPDCLAYEVLNLLFLLPRP